MLLKSIYISKIGLVVVPISSESIGISSFRRFPYVVHLKMGIRPVSLPSIPMLPISVCSARLGATAGRSTGNEAVTTATPKDRNRSPVSGGQHIGAPDAGLVRESRFQAYGQSMGFKTRHGLVWIEAIRNAVRGSNCALFSYPSKFAVFRRISLTRKASRTSPRDYVSTQDFIPESSLNFNFIFAQVGVRTGMPIPPHWRRDKNVFPVKVRPHREHLVTGNDSHKSQRQDNCFPHDLSPSLSRVPKVRARNSKSSQEINGLQNRSTGGRREDQGGRRLETWGGPVLDSAA